MPFPSRRVAGLLAHPTSLPGPAGAGDLGPAAERFLDWLVDAGVSVWQVLPLGPVGAGGSPYDSPSTFAGNPLLLSVERMERDGWARPERTGEAVGPDPGGPVDFGRAIPAKRRRLAEVWRRFPTRAGEQDRRDLEAFVDAPEQAGWLPDWCRFAAAADRLGHVHWPAWPVPLRDRDPGAWRDFERTHADALAFERWLQFAFHRQWRALSDACRRRGVTLFGDLPYYVAHHGADVWSRRELFAVDAAGHRLRVGGVPPDYFSEDGQLWGNPVYDWPAMAREGYAWWIERIAASLRRVGLLRLDHFRGFAGYWEIPARAATAREGRWVPGPGRGLFDALRRRLGTLALVAEDLGDITPDVDALRDDLDLPGMRILQFALGDNARHSPADAPERTVLYTGTHDNDTLVGWLDALDDPARAEAERLAGPGDGPLAGRLIEAALASPARLAVLPLQDALGSGGEARMNRPGVADGNWTWRAAPGTLSIRCAERLRRRVEEAGRGPVSPSTRPGVR